MPLARFSDYFLPHSKPRKFYADASGKVWTSVEFLREPADPASCFRLRQTDPQGVWQCDWLLREEPDGSVTEYGDTYPKVDAVDRAAFWLPDKRIIFRPGYEIRWGWDLRGNLYPDFLRSSPSEFGAFGSYRTVTQASRTTEDYISVYNEQTFGHTKTMVLFKCLKGLGPVELSYYTPTGALATTLKVVG